MIYNYDTNRVELGKARNNIATSILAKRSDRSTENIFTDIFDYGKKIWPNMIRHLCSTSVLSVSWIDIPGHIRW